MFAKIFEQIMDSSIADDPHLRHFFMDLLVLASKDGVVDMTPASIAARTRLQKDDVEKWLKALELDDPESRTKDHSGKRIVKLDGERTWGWKIVNWQKYREIATREMLRMGEADRKRAYRARFPDKHSQKKDKDREREEGESVTCPGQVMDTGSISPSVEAERPSLKEWSEFCQRIGIADMEYAKDKFLSAEQSNWQGKDNWRAYATRCKTWWESERKPTKRLDYAP